MVAVTIVATGNETSQLAPNKLKIILVFGSTIYFVASKKVKMEDKIASLEIRV